MLQETLGINEPEIIYGLRPGEALNCIHSDEMQGGCGTTASCIHCGAVNAIIKSQKEENILIEEECRLVVKNGNQSFDFLVRAKTLNLLDEKFILVIIRDNSNNKRRQVLERIFFHDILNTAGGIQVSGRGLGTYSIKLLGEKYLKGKVGFSSKDETGTLFWLKLLMD